MLTNIFNMTKRTSSIKLISYCPVVSYHSPSEHVNQSTNQELFQIQKVTNKNARPIQISVSANRSNHAKQRYEDMK